MSPPPRPPVTWGSMTLETGRGGCCYFLSPPPRTLSPPPRSCAKTTKKKKQNPKASGNAKSPAAPTALPPPAPLRFGVQGGVTHCPQHRAPTQQLWDVPGSRSRRWRWGHDGHHPARARRQTPLSPHCHHPAWVSPKPECGECDGSQSPPPRSQCPLLSPTRSRCPIPALAAAPAGARPSWQSLLGGFWARPARCHLGTWCRHLHPSPALPRPPHK